MKFLKFKKIKLDNRGAAALVTVIIVSVATLIMAISATKLGIGELDIAYTSQKGNEAFSIADGCAEEAMRRLRTDNTYTGNTFNLGAGSCIINITTVGSNKTLEATGSVDSYKKKISIDLSISNNIITINNWSEVSP